MCLMHYILIGVGTPSAFFCQRGQKSFAAMTAFTEADGEQMCLVNCNHKKQGYAFLVHVRSVNKLIVSPFCTAVLFHNTFPVLWEHLHCGDILQAELFLKI